MKWPHRKLFILLEGRDVWIVRVSVAHSVPQVYTVQYAFRVMQTSVSLIPHFFSYKKRNLFLNQNW